LRPLLESPNWTFQVFGLLRLERFEAETTAPILRAFARSPAWQVRCFAIRQAMRTGVTLSADLFADEDNPRVMRSALRYGVTIDPERIARAAHALMAMRAVDELLLGLELAQATDDAALRKEANARLERLLRNLDAMTTAVVSRRLACLLGVTPAPTSPDEWRDWYALQDGAVELAPSSYASFLLQRAPKSHISEIDPETLVRLRDYLDALRQEDLDVAIVMDCTSSMLPMINQTRAEVDNFIVFLNDIARGMRLGFVAYRDHDNPPVWEGVPLSDDVQKIRRFLFDVRITGGRDLPEAVFDGLAATLQLRWDESAKKQVVLVGDARPHDDDAYKIFEVLDTLGRARITVHAVHVLMEIPEQLNRRLSEADRALYREHNERTATAFKDIAVRGGGDLATLGTSDRLVPAIMHLTLHEDWWTAFDEFYDHYLTLCR
ncbi:MAG: VWA domain-containing protein, partial [Phycisphaerales bacterium]|nr:VWA domain-containing protein [Phycisphaerales bacterium]